MWGVKVRGRSDFKGFACRGVISWKGNNCGRSRVGWAEMELQIWPGLWPKRESLLSGPRLPARYQQLPPEAWLCQETPLLAVERRIIGTEVPFSSLMCFCIYVVHLQCWLNSVNGGRSRDTTLRTFSVSWEWMTSWGGVCVQRLGHSIPLEFRSMRSNQMGGEAPGKVILEPQPEPQIWPGLWPNRESLLSGPRQPARYQQLSPKAGLCQETSLLVVGRQIVGTEVSSFSLISLNPQFSLFLVQAIMISCMGNSLLALVTLTFIPLIRRLQWDLLGGTVDGSPPANAGDTGLIPVRARFHNAAEQLSPCTTTTEAACCNNWSPHLRPVFCSEKPPQWEARAPQRRAAPAHRN